MIFFSYLYGSATRLRLLEDDTPEAFDPLGGVGEPLPPPLLPLLLDDDDEPGGDFGGVAMSYSFGGLGDPLLEPFPFDFLPPP